MYNATDLVYTELKEDFDHYVSSFLEYRYTTKYSDVSKIGDKVFERYFPDGTLKDPLNGVKVCFSLVSNNKMFSKIIFYLCEKNNSYGIIMFFKFLYNSNRSFEHTYVYFKGLY